MKSSEPSEPKQPKSRLWRWGKRLLILSVVLGLCARLALQLLLPGVLGRYAGARGLKLEYENLDLSLATGRLELWNLKLMGIDEQASQPAALHTHLEYLTADLNISSLFMGELLVHRAEIDGLDVYATRESLAAGWSLAGLLPESSAQQPQSEPPGGVAPQEPPRDTDAFAGYDLGLPLGLRALRLQHLQLHVLDRTQEPPFESDVELNLRLTDLGFQGRPARLEVFARADPWLDSFSLQGSFQSQGQELEARLECEMEGLQPGELESFLGPLGLRAGAESLGFRMQADLQVRAAGEQTQALALQASLGDLAWSADGEECLAIDGLQLEVSRLLPDRVEFQTASLHGVRVQLLKRPEGALSVAGFDFVAPGGAVAEAQAEPAPEPSESVDSGGAARPWLSIPVLAFEDFQVGFEDQSLAPPGRLAWTLEAAELRGIELGSDAPDKPIELSAAMAADGLMDSMSVAGELRPFAERKSCELDLWVEGIKPTALEPYLNELGLRSDFDSGSLGAHLSAWVETRATGELGAQLQLTQVELSDGTELFGLETLGIEGLSYDPASGSTRIEELLLDGTYLNLERDSAGELHFFGLATGAAPQGRALSSSQGAASAAQPTASHSPARADLARLQVARLAWTGTRLGFEDASLTPVASLRLEEVGLELTGLDLGGESQRVVSPPAKFKLWFAGEGLADTLECEGSLQSAPGPLDLELFLQGRGRGLSYAALNPWLGELGLESQLERGALDLTLEAKLKAAEGGLQGSFELRDCVFREADQVLFSLSALELAHFAWGSAGRRLEGLVLSRPELHLARDRGGALLALGLRLPPSAGDALSDRGAGAPSPLPAAPAAADAPLAAGGQPARELEQALLSQVEFQLDAARVHWKDAALADGLATSLGLDASLDLSGSESGALAGAFRFLLHGEGFLESLEWKGELALEAGGVSSLSRFEMLGLRAGVLEPYLPPGLGVTLEGGQLQAEWRASYGQRPDGRGQAAELELKHLDYRDRNDESPLLGVERLALGAPRIDLAARVFELEELALSGVELDLRRGPQGAWRFLGLALDSAAAKAAEPAPSAAEAPTIDPKQEAPSEQAVAQAAAAPSVPPAPIPTLSLESLELGIERLRFLDESVPGALPLEAGWKLSSPGPMTLIAPEAGSLPPLELLLTARALPLLEELQTRLQLTPFQPEPGLRLELTLGGLKGAALTRVLPALEPLLDASALANGRFESALQANLITRRRSPVDFDLSAGFGLELELESLALWDQPEGELLAGIEGLSASVKSIRPQTGDVHIESLEVVRPSLHASKSGAGLQLLGILMKAAPEAQEAQEAQPEPGTEGSGAGDLASASEVATRGELRVDEFLISGADLSFVDRSVEPLMELPISDFDLELKRFSTRTLEAAEPFRFSATLYGGGIELPERNVAGNLLGGLLGSLGALVTSEDELVFESRPVFDELVLRGNLSLGPQPKGWTQLRLRALELPAFRGLVKQSGVDIGDGLLNESAMLHFDGLGGMRVSSDTNISYLSLSEPPGGPISSYLKLPAPLDTVLFVLRDEEGDQNIPLRLSVDEGGLSGASILAAVSQTLGLIIGDAIASSPMKIVGGVLDLAGLEAAPLELAGDERVDLEFPTGDVQPAQSMSSRLDPLLALLRRDPSLYLVLEHQLSAADLACADVLANPPVADCLDLAENLRRQRTGLLVQRARCVAELRTALAVGDRASVQAGRRLLRSLDNDLGAAESALDRVLDLTRAGAERGRARRARGTALEVARRRIEAVAEYLRAAPIPSIGTRVDARRPRFGVAAELEAGLVQVRVHRRP